jgi:hypothetical protein
MRGYASINRCGSSRYILDEIVSTIVLASAIIYGFLDGIVVVKNVNWDKVTTPQPLERHERLYPDASNFTQFFFTLIWWNCK